MSLLSLSLLSLSSSLLWGSIFHGFCITKENLTSWIKFNHYILINSTWSNEHCLVCAQSPHPTPLRRKNWRRGCFSEFFFFLRGGGGGLCTQANTVRRVYLKEITRCTIVIRLQYSIVSPSELLQQEITQMPVRRIYSILYQCFRL